MSRDPIRQPEQVLHVDCFGEAIELLRQKLNQRNVYCMNPAIDL